MNNVTKKSLLSGMLVLLFFLAQNVAGAGGNLSATDIENALASQGYDYIHVSVINPGTVKLTGDVSLLYDKFRIFEIVSGFPGVKEISNEVLVDTQSLPDDVIKENIINELQYIHAIKDPNEINVNVSEGDVHLTGTVDFYREKLMAETAVSWQQGVLGLVNDIKVIPKSERYTDENIKKMVMQVLDNRYSLEKQVNVNVSNGMVTLTGKVSSLWAKREIQKDINHLVGVHQIMNELSVM
jgi:osmotically-inducible protein OsmY